MIDRTRRIQRVARARSATTTLLCLLAILGCADSEPPPQVNESGLRLVLLIVVDQFRFDYLERFNDHYTGGLRWLQENGVVFTNARYDHATTATAPGHAAISSGLHPANSGMVGNSWYSRELGRQTYSFEDSEHQRSPANLLGRTLADWIEDLDPTSRAYGLSHKDRSAIALGGHGAEAAFWYATSTGDWVSSTYYANAQPEWMQEFRDRRLAEAQFGKSWEPMAVDGDNLEDLGVVEVDEGLFPRRLPYSFGSAALAPGGSFFGAVRSSPAADDYLLELAKTLLSEEEIGQGERLDFLGLGLSVLDAVGHKFGPDSPEVADTLLRLDRSLGEFFDFVDRTIGLDRVVVGFSSDHGVMPIPELTLERGGQAHRFGREDHLCIQRAGLTVERELGLEDWVLDGFYLDRASIEAAGATYETVESTLARELEKCDQVLRVWTRTELLGVRMDEPERFRRLYRHGFHSDRSADLKLQLLEGTVVGSSSRATHGSPYDYDTHVPFIIVAPGLQPSVVDDPVRPVDLAPTLAGLAGIPTPDNLDGRDLRPILPVLPEGITEKAYR